MEDPHKENIPDLKEPQIIMTPKLIFYLKVQEELNSKKLYSKPQLEDTNYYTQQEIDIINSLINNKPQEFTKRDLSYLLQKSIFAQHLKISHILHSNGAIINPYFAPIYRDLLAGEHSYDEMYIDFLINSIIKFNYLFENKDFKGYAYPGENSLRFLLRYSTHKLNNDPVLSHVLKRMIVPKNDLKYRGIAYFQKGNNILELYKKIIKIIIESKFEDINKQDKNGDTAFHYANKRYASCNKFRFFHNINREQCEDFFLDVIVLLNQNGANKNIRNNQGLTASDY